ncbi:MAG: hypothetical protein JWO98_2300 [Frankiales bacterium]|nr:hypothetical protein [Frankiales bacterium]
MRTKQSGTAPERRGAERHTAHAWRAGRLSRLGVPPGHAEPYADLPDWPAVAELVGQECSPTPASRLVH